MALDLEARLDRALKSADKLVTWARPFLKSAGGKTQLLPELLSRLPPSFGNYYEPFVGGGALFFVLRQRQQLGQLPETTRFIIGDANQDLIMAYKAVRDEPRELIRRLSGMKNTEKFFKAVRAIDPNDIATGALGRSCALAARFLYLNKTCFNGLHRVNKRGQFNVPFGHYAKPKIVDAENIRACSIALKGVLIMSTTFQATVSHAGPGDLVYFDPPYMPMQVGQFHQYGAGGFGPADHTILRDVAASLKARGVHVMISNSDTPFVRELYKDWSIDTITARRSINAKGDGRGRVNELVIR